MPGAEKQLARREEWRVRGTAISASTIGMPAARGGAKSMFAEINEKPISYRESTTAVISDEAGNGRERVADDMRMSEKPTAGRPRAHGTRTGDHAKTG